MCSLQVDVNFSPQLYISGFPAVSGSSVLEAKLVLTPCQPGYSAEKKLLVVPIFFINAE